MSQNFWESYPLQNLSTPNSDLNACASMMYMEMQKGLDSELAGFHCNRKGQTNFRCDQLISWLKGYNYDEATTKTVLRKFLELGVFAVREVSWVNDNPFYQSAKLQELIRSKEESVRKQRPLKTLTPKPKQVESSGLFDEIIMTDFIREDISCYQVRNIKTTGPYNTPLILQSSDFERALALDGPFRVFQIPAVYIVAAKNSQAATEPFGNLDRLVGYSKRVQLFSEKDSPMIDGRAVKRLFGRQYQIARGLLRVYPEGLTTTEMDKIVGGESKIDLKRLTEKQGWAEVVIRAGVNYQGKTRIL